MKKRTFLLLPFCLALIVLIGCANDDWLVSSQPPPPPEATPPPEGEKSILVYIGLEGSGEGLSFVEVKIPCLVIDGKTLKPPKKTWFQLHSSFLNAQKGWCDDVQARARIRPDGWVFFRFRNPAIKYNVKSFWDRYWITAVLPDQPDPCNGGKEWTWTCLPDEKSPFLRDDCQGNPGIEVVWQADNVCPLPAGWPCDTPTLPSEDVCG